MKGRDYYSEKEKVITRILADFYINSRGMSLKELSMYSREILKDHRSRLKMTEDEIKKIPLSATTIRKRFKALDPENKAMDCMIPNSELTPDQGLRRDVERRVYFNRHHDIHTIFSSWYHSYMEKIAKAEAKEKARKNKNKKV